jgi:methionyl-tRNA formyltransferase
MLYVFFGTPDFSARCLSLLLGQGLMPQAVVCNPDRPSGRKKILMAPPVKTTAEAWNAAHGTDIKILQPEKLDAAFKDTLGSFHADFFLVFAYNKIFRKDVLEIPRLGIIGIHPSFLPEYRGSSPFQTALLDGKKQTGVTLYVLDEGIDSGPVIATSEPLDIATDDNAHSLALKLADVGAELAITTLPRFTQGAITPEPQHEARATFTRKFKTEDGFVESADLTAAEHGNEKKAKVIFGKIRAFTPEPGCWTLRDGKRLKLLAATLNDGTLRLTRTQEEGGKPREITF